MSIAVLIITMFFSLIFSLIFLTRTAIGTTAINLFLGVYLIWMLFLIFSKSVPLAIAIILIAGMQLNIILVLICNFMLFNNKF